MTRAIQHEPIIMATHYQTVHEAIAASERILPGRAGPDGAEDPRWQAIIAVGDFVETEPQALWSFTQRWGTSPDADLRSAVATVLLEHLLEHHFDVMIDGVEHAALNNESLRRHRLPMLEIGSGGGAEPCCPIRQVDRCDSRFASIAIRKRRSDDRC